MLEARAPGFLQIVPLDILSFKILSSIPNSRSRTMLHRITSIRKLLYMYNILLLTNLTFGATNRPIN